MTALITHDDQATPERLTGILRRQGCLGHGRVVTVRKESPYFSGMSELSRLTLGYSSDASDSAPPRLLLKIPLSEPVQGYTERTGEDLRSLLSCGNWPAQTHGTDPDMTE